MNDRVNVFVDFFLSRQAESLTDYFLCFQFFYACICKNYFHFTGLNNMECVMYQLREITCCAIDLKLYKF